MNRTISLTLTMIVLAALSIFNIDHPEWLGDGNSFLKDLIGANLLNVLGVILAITLASAAQLHLEFNKAEERHQRRGFQNSRRAVRASAYTLIVLFCVSVAVLVCKPILAHAERGQAIFNSIELFDLFLSVICLIDITQGAFAIQSNIGPHQP